MAAFRFEPLKKSLSVDDSEQNVYLAMAEVSNALDVLRIQTSNGALVSAYEQ